MNLPEHVAIIMDGNGRWAQARGHSRIYGHIRGAKIAKNIIESSARLGVKNLTLFAFSTENWYRPQEEVSFLMRLLVRQLKKERAMLIEKNIRFNCIGEIHKLPAPVYSVIRDVIADTSKNTGLNLVFALSYGGRQELTSAVKSLAREVEQGTLKPSEINEELISRSLESSFLPDPDLIIRTSGEQRISNFFLWQMAYSELYFCEKLWPDFSTLDFTEALSFYQKRQRRFGRTKEQSTEAQPSPRTIDSASSSGV